MQHRLSIPYLLLCLSNSSQDVYVTHIFGRIYQINVSKFSFTLMLRDTTSSDYMEKGNDDHHCNNVFKILIHSQGFFIDLY